MLRAMAVASDDAPRLAADVDHVAIGDALVAIRHFRHRFAEAAEADLVTIERVFIPAGGAVEFHALFRRLAAGVGHEHAAGDVFEPAHPERGVELAADPTGETHVVGMHVRADHACDRLAFERCVEDGAPVLARFFHGDAGIDDGPAVAIFDEPEIDPFERERQRHAYPMHARRNLARDASLGRIAERIHKRRPRGAVVRYVLVFNAIHGHGVSLAGRCGVGQR